MPRCALRASVWQLFLKQMPNLTMAGTWWPKGSTSNNGSLHSTSSPMEVAAIIPPARTEPSDEEEEEELTGKATHPLQPN